MVSKPLQLTLADLQKLPQHTVPAALECTGNGRALLHPKVPGHPVGPRRGRQRRVDRAAHADVLKAAGASAVRGIAGDRRRGLAASLQTPDFVRSMPMKKAMHPATLLALKMNGQPLPDIHGVSGAADRAGLGRHELGEMGGAALGRRRSRTAGSS